MSFKTLEKNLLDLTGSVLGEDVTYTPAVGSAVSIKAIFDNAYVDIKGIVSLHPTLRINLSDLPADPRKGDSVTVSSVSYRVVESRADGYGGSTLILAR